MLSARLSLTMGRRDYRPWSDEEEEKLEEWVAQHLDLTWPERAEKYSKTFCPRSSESLRSKLRQVTRNISTRPAFHTRHLRRRRGLVPSWTGSCSRYITSRQIYAGTHELPSAENRPLRWNTLSVNANAAARCPDKSKSLKRPVDHNRIDLSRRSTSKTTQNTHARGDTDHPMLSQRNPPGHSSSPGDRPAPKTSCGT